LNKAEQMAEASDLAEQFAAELQSGSAARVALAIARIAFPALQPDDYLAKLDEMARVVAPRIIESEPGGTRALALMQTVRLDLGLRGNSEHYYDATNSYLNTVIERGSGLPIMLSLIIVEIGQRLGLEVEGVGFPGHFMVRYTDEDGVWFLDPFHGAVMTPEDVPAYFLKLFGQSILVMDESYFGPFPLDAWAQRILNNLRAAYLNSGEVELLAKLLPLMLVLDPNRQELWRELGLVEYRRGELTAAVRALRRFFYLQGHLVLVPPNSTVPPSPPILDEPGQQLWSLLEEIESARTRWN
jgi:regulator of sirC expression with transglutaminase-like and TPR domain